MHIKSWMDNRGYMDIDELIYKFHKLTFYDIKSLWKPDNARADWEFVLRREHTHVKWNRNKLKDNSIAHRMPFIKCSSKQIQDIYPHLYSAPKITPQAIKPKRSLNVNASQSECN